jgi:hypothetical protein
VLSENERNAYLYIQIVSVGKLKEKYLKDAVNNYIKLLSLFKILLIIALLKFCNIPQKKYYIKPVALTSVFTAEAYYYEDGGG